MAIGQSSPAAARMAVTAVTQTMKQRQAQTAARSDSVCRRNVTAPFRVLQ